MFRNERKLIILLNDGSGGDDNINDEMVTITILGMLFVDAIRLPQQDEIDSV